MSKNNAQEQIIAKLKESESILIAVNDNPSVDELSSALALTLAINNSGKHATAVSSGKMPDALTFLRPEKTFENSVDSLRDFIIALNKEKADHLRYKLVGDHVKIFITPYRSVISEKDLEFEQGDFNIDFVLALNVESQDRLDGALAAHGRIFHDASVGILTVGENQTNLNGTHWHAENASSLSELAVQIIESLGKKNLIQSVATALLTGVVAETDRFSNSKATAEVMSLAAKLISSGADQQLVVSKIREAEEKAGEFAVQKNAKMEEALEEISNEKEEIPASKTEQKRDGAFVIAHEEAKLSENTQTENSENPQAEDELENSLNTLNNINAPQNAFEDLKEETEQNQENQLDEVFENPTNVISETPVPEQTFEPAQQVEISVPTFEEQPQQAEIPAESVFEQPVQNSSIEGLVEAPIQNYSPEIPVPSVPFENQNAFISETPVPEQTFEPAQQVEISVPTFEEQPQQAEIPAESVFEQPVQLETQPQQIAGGLMGTQPFSPSQAPQEIAAVSNPESNDYILSHNKTQNTVYEELRNNENFIPETNEYAQAATIQPLSNYESSMPISNEQYAQSIPQASFENPAQNYSTEIPAQNLNDFTMPMPPAVPDFSTMPMPPEIPNFDVIPNPAEQPAMGAQNSGNKIMTDQIYPNDPSQFRIPGM